MHVVALRDRLRRRLACQAVELPYQVHLIREAEAMSNVQPAALRGKPLCIQRILKPRDPCIELRRASGLFQKAPFKLAQTQACKLREMSHTHSAVMSRQVAGRAHDEGRCSRAHREGQQVVFRSPDTLGKGSALSEQMPQVLKATAQNLLSIVVKICEERRRNAKELPRGIRPEKESKADDVTLKAMPPKGMGQRSPKIDRRTHFRRVPGIIKVHAITYLERKHLLEHGNVGLTGLRLVRADLALRKDANVLAQLRPRRS